MTTSASSTTSCRRSSKIWIRRPPTGRRALTRPGPGEVRKDANDPSRGDAHLWGVWHGGQPFEWYRSCEHRFNSEFGFQSFPEPRTVASFTEPADRNITSPVMEHHQRSGIGNTTIIRYMLDWFRMPTSFEQTLWLSQILQGLAVQYAVEHWRRGMPRGMGTLYWQLNDCWPVASWSSIDSHGRWKALHYLARRFYAPVLVSGVEDGKLGKLAIHLTSDLLKSCSGRLRWAVTRVSGKRLAGGSRELRVAPGRSRRVQSLDLRPMLEAYGERDLLIWLEFTGEGPIRLQQSRHLRPAQGDGAQGSANRLVRRAHRWRRIRAEASRAASRTLDLGRSGRLRSAALGQLLSPAAGSIEEARLALGDSCFARTASAPAARAEPHRYLRRSGIAAGPR